MEHAIKIASAIVDRLPKDTCSPETTEGREGFLHPIGISGALENATIDLIVRDFTDQGLKQKEALLEGIVKAVMKDYPRSTYRLEIKQQYRNMKQVIDRHPEIVDNAMEAIRRAGLKPVKASIRGGTDGSRLSFMGLPCPNIFAGEHAFHSRLEWVSRQDMEKAVADHRASGDDFRGAGVGPIRAFAFRRFFRTPRRHHPDRSAQRHRLAAGERRQRLADRSSQPPRTSSADGPPMRGWPGRFRATASTAASMPLPTATSRSSWHGSISISAKSGLAENPMDALLGSKRKRPGIFRAGLRQLWHVPVDRLQRRHHPRIFARLTPAREASRPVGRSALRILANDSRGSAKNITPNREASRSKLAGSNG